MVNACLCTHVGVRVWASCYMSTSNLVSMSICIYLYMCRCMRLYVDMYMCMNVIVSCMFICAHISFICTL